MKQLVNYKKIRNSYAASLNDQIQSGSLKREFSQFDLPSSLTQLPSLESVRVPKTRNEAQNMPPKFPSFQNTFDVRGVSLKDNKIQELEETLTRKQECIINQEEFISKSEAIIDQQK